MSQASYPPAGYAYGPGQGYQSDNTQIDLGRQGLTYVQINN